MGPSRRSIALLLSLGVAACGGGEDKSGGSGPEPSIQPLTATGFSLEWGTPGAPSSVKIGQRFAAAVLVKNTGDQPWLDPWTIGGARPHAGGAVRLGYRWWKAGDRTKPYADYTNARADLRAPVQPWDTAVIAIEVAAPSEPGEYELQLDLVQELVAWFETQGAPRLAVSVNVSR